jgi:hypothetical protein
MPEFSEFDFGLTAFAGQFHQDWRYEGTPAVMLAGCLTTIDPRDVGVLRDDARLALAGLPAEQVEALWVAGTSNFGFGPHHPEATSGPVWLETIIGGGDRWFAERGGVPPKRRPPELVDEVAAQIVPIIKAPGGRWGYPPADEISAALLACARHCSADLAFRFLMRSIIQQGAVTLTTAQFDGLRRLSDRFDYGEYIVGDAEYLVE